MTIQYDKDMRKFSFIALVMLLIAFGLITLDFPFRSKAAVIHDVPFTTQAPLGNWSDGRQKYGCEEASLIMAYEWVSGVRYTPEETERLITGMADFEQYFWGFNYDTSAVDTAKLYHEFFGENNVQVVYNVLDEDMVRQLDAGKILLVPINANWLDPIQYRRGPVRHMIVVLGYDGNSEEFIVHDPLLNSGANLRFGRKKLEAALRDYPSGTNLSVTERRSAMVVIGKDFIPQRPN